MNTARVSFTVLPSQEYRLDAAPARCDRLRPQWLEKRGQRHASRRCAAPFGAAWLYQPDQLLDMPPVSEAWIGGNLAYTSGVMLR